MNVQEVLIDLFSSIKLMVLFSLSFLNDFVFISFFLMVLCQVNVLPLLPTMINTCFVEFWYGGKNIRAAHNCWIDSACLSFSVHSQKPVEMWISLVDL